MPRTVIIIRHAAPAVRPDRSPESWPLSAAGRRAAGRLRGQVPSVALLASSRELKAVQTVSLVAGVAPAAIHQDDHFGEVHRPDEPFDDDHRARRRAWVEERRDERHTSWETPQEAGRRFQEGLDNLDVETIVVGTHGMVLTAWLMTIGYVARGASAGDFWERLPFPDLLVVSRP
ncbi:histidine phosphatase family protein [Microlunatus elymi]|uniref:Histidine phosphatase family protein n=1 Tax=Microlunatus elymi TaxID=2596828 RepID=A0A516PYG0_9ACTN|nr:histidine phosphatase family protein [Microlunatus elymi]QDP96203.1 histidine phosphatase family protein [Microlunatus elymi]